MLAKVKATDIVGIGVDFTACTMLPITKDGTPLMFLDRFRDEPHAWVKLWKHHGAQRPRPIGVNALAAKRGEKFPR